jgi:hypothetical protein
MGHIVRCFHHIKSVLRVVFYIANVNVAPMSFLTEHHPMKAYWGWVTEVYLHVYLTSALDGQLHAPVALPPGKEPLVLIGWETGWALEPVWTRC